MRGVLAAPAQRDAALGQLRLRVRRRLLLGQRDVRGVRERAVPAWLQPVGVHGLGGHQLRRGVRGPQQAARQFGVGVGVRVGVSGGVRAADNATSGGRRRRACQRGRSGSGAMKLGRPDGRVHAGGDACCTSASTTTRRLSTFGDWCRSWWR